jgi:hypothetical protein
MSVCRCNAFVPMQAVTEAAAAEAAAREEAEVPEPDEAAPVNTSAQADEACHTCPLRICPIPLSVHPPACMHL